MHIKIRQKLFPRGCRGIQNVPLSVCPSPLQSEITFDPVVASQPNFKGELNSLQVIFGQVIWTLRPTGSALNPEKRVLHQIYLFPGFWGRGGVIFIDTKSADFQTQKLVFQISVVGFPKRSQPIISVNLKNGRTSTRLKSFVSRTWKLVDIRYISCQHLAVKKLWRNSPHLYIISLLF